jgi:hypothetical protein
VTTGSQGNSNARGVIPSTTLQQDVKVYIEAVGWARAVEQLKVARSTLGRIRNGKAVRLGSVSLVAHNLPKNNLNNVSDHGVSS